MLVPWIWVLTYLGRYQAIPLAYNPEMNQNSSFNSPFLGAWFQIYLGTVHLIGYCNLILKNNIHTPYAMLHVHIKVYKTPLHWMYIHFNPYNPMPFITDVSGQNLYMYHNDYCINNHTNSYTRLIYRIVQNIMGLLIQPHICFSNIYYT